MCDSSTDPLLTESSQKEMKTLTVVKHVPRGKVVTYGMVGHLACLPRRAPLAGQVLARSSLADAVPWHRVVSSQGISPLRGQGRTEQHARRAVKGVRLDRRNRIDLTEYG